MNKIIGIILGVFCWIQTTAYAVVDKFDVLPDLPDPLAYAVPSAEASTVSNSGEVSLLGAQSVGHGTDIVSVVISLAFVILLIYLTGILYAKLNKAGFQTLKRQQGELSRSCVSVLSTTQLGNNKTLHVVELDGKRMLIGASSGAIHLIKDLGSYNESGDEEYSHIEIPNIKIPKIEIPKIEIPTIGFSKMMTKAHKPLEDVENEVVEEEFVKEDNPDEIISSLFNEHAEQAVNEKPVKSEHMVDPDEFALYKKYLGG